MHQTHKNIWVTTWNVVLLGPSCSKADQCWPEGCLIIVILGQLPTIHKSWYKMRCSPKYIISYVLNQNYNKMLKSDWLSTALISALIGQYASCLKNWTACAITRMLIKLFFHLLARKSWNFLSFDFKKSHIYHSDVLLKLWLICNRTSCRPIRSVIILVIKQIGLPWRGCPILLITHMIRDQIGLHSVLLP